MSRAINTNKVLGSVAAWMINKGKMNGKKSDVPFQAYGKVFFFLALSD